MRMTLPCKVSTRWDALRHLFHCDEMYNGFDAALEGAWGKRLGQETSGLVELRSSISPDLKMTTGMNGRMITSERHRTAEPRCVGADVLRQFAVRALTAAGMSNSDAAIVADSMVEADLTGADSHGIFRLPQYVGWFDSGKVNPRGKVTVDYRRTGVAIVDGGRGMGHLGMTRAVDVANALASKVGVAWVGLRRSNHAGAIGVYAAQLARKGKIGICAAVSSINHMAPSGSAEALLGTNPIAIGIPAGEKPPIIVDIATSVASFGKIRSAALESQPIPVGWAIERATGKPLTDPDRIEQGLLAALGDYKGAGLALALGLLAGVLNGASFGREIPDFAAPSSSPVNVGQFVIALDVHALRPLANFGEVVGDHIDSFVNSTRLPGQDRVRLPGQDRAARRSDRERNGIPMSNAKLSALQKLADELGIPPCS
jgi:L-2-hydroxycarboxylate dehydrogenase (NAD+)